MAYHQWPDETLKNDFWDLKYLNKILIYIKKYKFPVAVIFLMKSKLYRYYNNDKPSLDLL